MKKQEDRLLFLKEFTKELVLQSKPPESEKAGIREGAEEKREEKTGHEIMVPSVLKTEEVVKKQEEEISSEPVTKPLQARPLRRRAYRLKPQFRPLTQARPIAKPFRPIRQETKPVTPKTQPQIKPQPYSETLDLGKLNLLVQDPKVTVIECPGPGKFVLARTLGKITTTKISLNKEEIQDIINKFSEKAKIPVISGLFKAAVGNLIITAVISELVGSRFIITKITRLSMLEQAGRRQARWEK